MFYITYYGFIVLFSLFYLVIFSYLSISYQVFFIHLLITYIMDSHQIVINEKFYYHLLFNSIGFIKCQLPLSLSLDDVITFVYVEKGIEYRLVRNVYCFHFFGSIGDTVGYFSLGVKK